MTHAPPGPEDLGRSCVGGGSAAFEPTAIVFDIQRFAVHDGPGIRTLVFLKGCPLRCEWCSNPESQERAPQLVVFPGRCIGCGRCIDICPEGAVSPHADGAPRLDRDLCVECGVCSPTCYADARLLLGVRKTVSEVMDEVRKDAAFYRSSGGGVTVGGGEPLVWPEFVLELLSRCRADGIDTAIETCGDVPWAAIEPLLDVVDLFFYDIKHMDAGAHRRLTGAGNALVLRNLRALAGTGASIVVRIPVIPGRNDDRENIRATAEFVRGHGIARRIELLPYHRFAEDKYARLGREYGPSGLEPPSDGLMRSLAAIVEEEGVQAQIGG